VRKDKVVQRVKVLKKVEFGMEKTVLRSTNYKRKTKINNEINPMTAGFLNP
jgi:hypothetical protein